MAEDSELELKFIDSIKTVARTNKWDFEKVPDADSYRYELRIMDGEMILNIISFLSLHLVVTME